MRKILSSLLILISFAGYSQTKISQMPLRLGKTDSARIPVVYQGVNLSMYAIDISKSAGAGSSFDTTGKFSAYQNALNLRLKIADTASMFAAHPSSGSAFDTTGKFTNYQSAINARLKYTDTSGMLSAYRTTLNSHTASLLLKLNISDTAGMLANYATGLNTRTSAIALKLNISDTTAMLANYATALNAKSVAIALKLNISDTASMLGAYQTALNTRATVSNLALKVNIADTSTMLSAYRSGKVNVSDTSSMLTAYRNGLNADVAAIALKADKSLTLNAQTASYTGVLGDAGKVVTLSNASANNFTVPLNSSVAYPVGTQITVVSLGAGQTTIVATGGVTINSASSALKLRVQYSSGTLIKTATDTWLLIGDITP